MKRLIFCITILVLMAGQSIGSLWVLHYRNETFSAVLEQAVVLAENQQKEAALQALEEVKTEWSDYYTTVSYLVPAGRIEPVCYSIAKLESLLESDNPEFFSECDTIFYTLEFLYEKEFPYLHSII